METTPAIDINALKAQVDAEIAARLLVEADAARYIQRRGFRIGDLRLLVRLDATSEVLETPPLFRLPGAPAGIRGLANRHGRVVPVVDLSILFGTQQAPAGRWILVCGRGDEAVGLLIDSLPERKKFVQQDEIAVSGISHPVAAYAKAAYQESSDEEKVKEENNRPEVNRRSAANREERPIWIDLDTEKLFTAIFHVESSLD